MGVAVALAAAAPPAHEGGRPDNKGEYASDDSLATKNLRYNEEEDCDDEDDQSADLLEDDTGGKKRCRESNDEVSYNICTQLIFFLVHFSSKLTFCQLIIFIRRPVESPPLYTTCSTPHPHLRQRRVEVMKPPHLRQRRVHTTSQKSIDVISF